MIKIHLATSNQGKVDELREMVGGSFELLTRPELLEATVEDQDTLELNAIKKAQEVSDFCGGLALADDSGLFVDALDGLPGVYSARFFEMYGDGHQLEESDSEEDQVDSINTQLLLVRMKDSLNRKARFKCVLALVGPDVATQTFEGVVEGEIAERPAGDNGFGYDPIFVPEGCKIAFAEMSSKQKNELSHRRRALVKFVGAVQSWTA